MTFTSQVSGYSNFFTNNFILKEEGNAIGSPMGSWIHLALLSYGLKTAFSEAELQEVEEKLGASVDESYAKVVELAENQPLLVSLAMGFWVSELYSSAPLLVELERIVGALKSSTIGKSLPTQDEINVWTHANSKGLIEEFPSDVSNPDLQSIVANIVATKFSWMEAFREVPAPDSMNHWQQVTVLFDKTFDATNVLRVEGKYYVLHAKTSDRTDDGLLTVVYSLIGDDTADKETLAGIIQRVSAEEAWLESVKVPVAELATLTDLPDFITATSEKRKLSSAADPYEVQAFLPAWDAEATMDLNEAGFGPIANVLAREVDLMVDTKQVAIAAYNKNGYEAAALTYSLMARAAMPSFREVDFVTVITHFDKPYISLATVKASRRVSSEWIGLPLFISWVETASAVSDKRF